jgi:hypothetical protein
VREAWRFDHQMHIAKATKNKSNRMSITPGGTWMVMPPPDDEGKEGLLENEPDEEL